MEKVRRRISFDSMEVVETMGKVGGMTVFWNKEDNIKKVVTTSFTMEILIGGEGNQEDRWCIGTYASVNNKIRKEQWKVINRRKVLWGTKWLLIGDLNDIKSNEEKWGGRIREDWTFVDFKKMIDDNELQDIGFRGDPWTWTNKWFGIGEIKQRLDRGLGTVEWTRQFESAICHHIHKEASDHSMLVVDLNPAERNHKKRFIFDKRWLAQTGINEVIGGSME